jgi:adenylyltransferase/sulfurtransferase
MGLTDQQIERYARQIIVPGVGGIAQERLLSARIMLVGKAADLSSVLMYMVGAGIGEIQLRLPAADYSEQHSLMAHAFELNPDVVVRPEAKSIEELNLVFAIGGGSEVTELILSPPLVQSNLCMIFVQPAMPCGFAIFSRRPPCLLCADADLMESVNPRGDAADFVAMVAATEAFKLLAGSPLPPSSMLFEFDGFACAARELKQRSTSERCSCSTE